MSVENFLAAIHAAHESAAAIMAALDDHLGISPDDVRCCDAKRAERIAAALAAIAENI